MPVTIFFCYAREDEVLLNKLKTHLRPLQQQGLIEVWYDREINAGTEWEPEIKKHVNSALLILLLVSPDFMDSEYCYSIEMQRALERHAKGEAKVIPVILRPVYWHGEPLGKLQALPTDGKPVTSSYWKDPDSALYDVTSSIYKVVMQLTSPPAFVSPPIPQEGQQGITKPSTTIPAIQQGEEFAISPAPLAVEKLSQLPTLIDHSTHVLSMAISPDGQTLVSAGRKGAIKVWSLSTGKALRTLTGHSTRILSIAISPDGQTLVSGSEDGAIKVWRT